MRRWQRPQHRRRHPRDNDAIRAPDPIDDDCALCGERKWIRHQLPGWQPWQRVSVLTCRLTHLRSHQPGDQYREIELSGNSLCHGHPACRQQ